MEGTLTVVPGMFFLFQFVGPGLGALVPIAGLFCELATHVICTLHK